MEGFTPINAFASTASGAKPTDSTDTYTTANRNSSKSIASDYLCHGKTVSTAPVACQALREEGAGDVSGRLAVTKPVRRGDSSANTGSMKKLANAKIDTGSMLAGKSKPKRAQDDRIDEALNTSCSAVCNNKNVLLELSARVTASWREEQPGRHQRLVLHDLSYDTPPYLTGTFDLWNQSRSWELDSSVFFAPREEGVMCRAPARTKRDDTKWRLEVLSIWGAS